MKSPYDSTMVIMIVGSFFISFLVLNPYSLLCVSVFVYCGEFFISFLTCSTRRGEGPARGEPHESVREVRGEVICRRSSVQVPDYVPRRA
jgi:hypothetical protein